MKKLKLLCLSMLALTLGAHATCLPSSMSAVVSSTNDKGSWIGWWCGPNEPYIAACTSAGCASLPNRKKISAFISKPDLKALNFGRNVWTDPTMLAIWQPEKAKLIALRPAK